MEPDGLDTVVEAIRPVADGVVEVVLASPTGEPLPTWKPGAHVDLCLPTGVRQYSLCGDAADRSRYRLGILLEPAGRGGSRYVHTSLRPGDRVRVRGPRNKFPLLRAGAYLFVAGGIGITPLLPMIREVESHRLPWRLVYGGRSRTSMAFLDEMSAYGDKVLIWPQDEVGLLNLPESVTPHDEAAVTAVYSCGPEPMLDAVIRHCAATQGLEAHVERFAPSAGRRTTPRTAFDVHCAESGCTLRVEPEQTILDVLLGAGIDASYDCRDGSCGTCELDLLEGNAEHLDSVFGDADRDHGVIFPCVSRARGRLVLDI